RRVRRGCARPAAPHPRTPRPRTPRPRGGRSPGAHGGALATPRPIPHLSSHRRGSAPLPRVPDGGDGGRVMRKLILGTAGHIDHGKTTLVRALTGVDTDRLAEEKRRGITIDLGFARLALGDDIEL